MPEYVYALHDFHPEHEDEIAFHAGQPIEVIERDDQYSDGWWQVSTSFIQYIAPHGGMYTPPLFRPSIALLPTFSLLGSTILIHVRYLSGTQPCG